MTTLLQQIRKAQSSDDVELKNRALAASEIMLAEYLTRIEEQQDELNQCQKDNFMMQATIQKLINMVSAAANQQIEELRNAIDGDWREQFKLAVSLNPEAFADFFQKINVKR